MRRLRGFSLMELVVATAIFLVVIVLIFGLFQYGSRMFQLSVLRQGLQAEGTAAGRHLQTDLRRTHYDTVTVVKRQVTVNGQTVNRDGLCLGGVRSWEDPACYDDMTGLPLWDAYYVWYATTDPEGGLVRAVVPSPTALGSPVRLSTFGETGNMRNDPATNLAQLAFVRLSSQVFDFEVNEDDATRSLTVTIRLLQSGDKAPTAHQKVVESYQLDFSVRPQNTWP